MLGQRLALVNDMLFLRVLKSCSRPRYRMGLGITLESTWEDNRLAGYCGSVLCQNRVGSHVSCTFRSFCSLSRKIFIGPRLSRRIELPARQLVCGNRHWCVRCTFQSACTRRFYYGRRVVVELRRRARDGGQ